MVVFITGVSGGVLCCVLSMLLAVFLMALSWCLCEWLSDSSSLGWFQKKF